MTMFDKLGDLLSEALEKGELPKSGETSQNERIENTFSDFNFIQKEAEKASPPPAQKTKKRIPAGIKAAFDFIGISEEADFDSAKRIYREKLMYYHPDRRNDNPVLQKVAKEKTAQLLKEWKLIESWYESNKAKKLKS